MLSRGCAEISVQESTKRHAVLVLAGMAVIFFIVACMELFWICDHNSAVNALVF